MSRPRFRYSLSFSALLLVNLCVSIAAYGRSEEAAGATRDDRYYPLRRGASWWYQMVETQAGAERRYKTQLTNRSAQIVGNQVATPQLLAEDGAGDFLNFLVADVTGVYSIASQFGGDDAPQQKERPYIYLATPYELGTSWTIQSNTFMLKQLIEINLETSIIKTGENVSVPAGQFTDCLVTRGIARPKLQMVSEPQILIALEVESLNWWCSDAGLVKSSYRETSDSEALGSGSLTMELLSVSGMP